MQEHVGFIVEVVLDWPDRASYPEMGSDLSHRQGQVSNPSIVHARFDDQRERNIICRHSYYFFL